MTDEEKTEMGKTYFECKFGDTSTLDVLKKFFIGLGFEQINNESVRPLIYKKGNCKIKIIWFHNVCEIRQEFDSFDGIITESSFDKIIGSFLPYVNHETFSFYNKDVETFKLAIPKE